MWKEALAAIFLFIATNCVVWFQLNLQYINEWWKQNEILLVTLTALPVAFGYYYAWTFAIAAFGQWWTARFIGFALSFFVFAPLTWYFLGEPFFTPKVMLCTLLAFLIIVIHVLLP